MVALTDAVVAPPFGTSHDQTRRIGKVRQRGDQTLQVLARLDGADEQEVVVGQPIELTHAGDLLLGGALGLHAERHQTQPIGVDPGCQRIVHRCLAAAQHQIGAALDLVQAAPEHGDAMAGELTGIVQERQIVQRHDQLGVGGARDECGGVSDVDLAGSDLHLRPLHAEPGFVEPRRRDGKVRDGDRGNPRIEGQVPVPAGDADQANIVVRPQCLGDPERGHTGAAGYSMPTLLKGVRDSHAPHHALPRRSIVPMTGFWSGRRVVVTGGAGFLGRVVVEKLRALGADVAVPRSRDYDLTRPGVAEQLLADTVPTHIVHLAARVGGIGYNQVAPAPLYLDNLLMGTHVIEAARMAPTVEKTVLLGTVCSYPKFTPVPFREESLWDGYPEETNAPYGIAKKAHLIHAQVNRQQYGQKFAYLIPTNLYGPGDKFHPSVSHVIPARIKGCVEAKEQGDQKLSVWGTGTASREYLFVDDAADALVIAAEHYEGSEPVNLGTNREITIRETVELVAKMVGYDGELVWDPTKPDGQPRRRVDPGRAEALFGWRAQMPFEEGLRRTIDWYLANREEAEREPS